MPIVLSVSWRVIRAEDRVILIYEFSTPILHENTIYFCVLRWLKYGHGLVQCRRIHFRGIQTLPGTLSSAG